MRLTVQHLRNRHRNDACTIRITRMMAGHSVDEPPSEFMQGLWAKGHEHEQHVVAGHGEHLDLSGGTPATAIARTREALAEPPLPVLRHPMLEGEFAFGGDTVTLRGVPDLLVAEAEGWRIVEAKLSAREQRVATSQLGMYAMLLERATGSAPVALEIVLRSGESIDVQLDEAIEHATSDIDYLLSMRDFPAPTYEPVNAKRCSGCALHHECWSRAMRTRDVAVLPTVKQRAARVLHHHGLGSFDALAKADPASLPTLAVPEELGAGGNQIGAKTALQMVAQASAMRAGAAYVTRDPDLPIATTWVMFDIENAEQASREAIRVFQWGLKTCREGEAPVTDNPIVDITSDDADRDGWHAFLARARETIEADPSTCFAHWSGHDPRAIRSYVERFGDDEHATAAAILDRCIDLHVVTARSCELPTVDRSIKQVATWLGANLADHALGGTGAMAQYDRLVAGDAGTDEPWIRARLERYNACDLDALEHVLIWLHAWAGAPVGALVDRHGRMLVDEGDPTAEPATEMETFERITTAPSDRLPAWRTRQIEAIATELLARSGVDTALPQPVDVREIARLAKLPIIDSPDGVAGVAAINDDGRPLSGFTKHGTLYIDSREPTRRQRFTIAHEIAHVVLGHLAVLGESHKLASDTLDDDVERLFGPRSASDATIAAASRLVEREANLLAGQLLVPAPALDAAIEQHGLCLPVLAEEFDVSVPLVRVRAGGRLHPTIRRVSVW